MKNQLVLGQAQFLDLGHLQQDEEDIGQENQIEQNLENESNKMLETWDQPLPQSKTYKRDLEVEQTLYYDGSSFEDMKASMDELPGGYVHVKILQANPEGAQVRADTTIVFDRICFLEYNPIAIESSITDGKPSIVNLNYGALLPGLIQGLLALRQGERANILIHPALAYKKLGVLPLIPPDSYLFYCVKIYKVLEESDLDIASRYEIENCQVIPISEKIKIIKEHNDVAKKYLLEDQPREALIRYKAAIKWAQLEDDIIKENDKEWRDLLEVLYQNAAIVYNKLNMPKSASKAAKQALTINAENMKAYFQLSKARLSIGDHAGALKAVERAHQLDKQNVSINNLRLQIDAVFRDNQTERDAIMKRMSKAFS